MPNIAISISAGKGGWRGRPLTKCRAGTCIGSLRPGSASATLGIRVFSYLPNMVLSTNILGILPAPDIS
jgi:hypothetical protein